MTLDKNNVLQVLNSHIEEHNKNDDLVYLELCVTYFEINKNWQKNKERYGGIGSEHDVVSLEIENSKDRTASCINSISAGEKLLDFIYRVFIAVIILLIGSFVNKNLSSITYSNIELFVYVLSVMVAFIFGIYAKVFFVALFYKLRQFTSFFLRKLSRGAGNESQ